MNLKDADKVLAPYLVQGPWTKDTVKAAFAAAVKALHPDTKSALSDGFVPIPMATLKDARDVLLRHYGPAFEAADKACPTCKATGFVGFGFSRQKCPRGCVAEP